MAKSSPASAARRAGNHKEEWQRRSAEYSPSFLQPFWFRVPLLFQLLRCLLQALAALEIENPQGEKGDGYNYEDQISHAESPTGHKFRVRVLRKR
jgi:hypothetical protein